MLILISRLTCIALLLNGTVPSNSSTTPTPPEVSTTLATVRLPDATAVQKRGVPGGRWLSRARVDAETLPEGDTSIAKANIALVKADRPVAS